MRSHAEANSLHQPRRPFARRAAVRVRRLRQRPLRREKRRRCVSRVSPKRILESHPHNQARIAPSTRGRPGLRFELPSYSAASRSRTQRSSVSGVTIIEITRSRRRPSRFALRTSPRRSASVNRRRCPLSGSRGIRFSSCRYSITSCRCSAQPSSRRNESEWQRQRGPWRTRAPAWACRNGSKSEFLANIQPAETPHETHRLRMGSPQGRDCVEPVSPVTAPESVSRIQIVQ
jgi:hypothetical protein